MPLPDYGTGTKNWAGGAGGTPEERRRNRENAWLNRKGLGLRPNPYRDEYEKEYLDFEKKLTGQGQEAVGKIGYQAAMTGGRESSDAAQGVSAVQSSITGQLLGARNAIQEANTAYDTSEQLRMQNEIAERNKNRGEFWGGLVGGLPIIGKGIASLIQGGDEGTFKETQAAYLQAEEAQRAREAELDQILEAYAKGNWG